MTIVDISKVLVIAIADLGRGERTGRNDGAFVEGVLGEPTPASGVGQPWCAAMVMRWYERAGYTFARTSPRGPAWMVDFWKCRAVAELYRQLDARGCRVGQGDQIEPGDLCIQLGQVAHAGATGHVDMVVEVIRASDAVSVVCVGGNVGNAVRRSRRRAFASEVTAYVRPRRLFERNT